jgi:hypothetical protein
MQATPGTEPEEWTLDVGELTRALDRPDEWFTDG